jgi:hypothetical protein
MPDRHALYRHFPSTRATGRLVGSSRHYSSHAMSWRWVIDGRERPTKVDWKWLAIAYASGGLIVAALAWAFTGTALIAVLVVLAVVGISFDIITRRRHPEN